MRADSLAGRFNPPGFRYAPGSPCRKLLDQRRKEILVKFDANKDGKLDDVEMGPLKAVILAGSIDEADQKGPQAGHKSSRDVNCAPNQKTMAPRKK